MGAVIAIGVAAVTLILVVTRPWRLDEGTAALLGGALALAVGAVPVGDAARLELNAWNVYLFFLGMMAIAALSDQSGIFDHIAYLAARVAAGRVILLYLLVFVLGALISCLFANDSAALVLTPIVYALVLRLSLSPLPFVFATTFIADTASVALPVSNPLNVILVDSFHLDLGSYVAHLWLSALLAIVVNLIVFLLLFRHGISGRFQPSVPPHAHPARGATGAILLLLAAGYLVASAYRFPLGVVALGGGVALALNLLRGNQLSVRRLAGDMSWPIFGFLAGMLVVVDGLERAGVTSALGRALLHLGGSSQLTAIAVTVIGGALGSNLINNLPMALVMVSAIRSLHLAAALRVDLVYATILGCDLGPNLTHLGSLATLIWLLFLRRKGLDVSAWDYFRIGAIVSPLLILAAIFGLWLTSGMH